MKAKTQKDARKGAHPFYDRKVRAEGYTRALSLGRIIPKDWKYVRVEVLDASTDDIVLKIRKLYAEEEHARIKETDKTS